MNVEASHIMLGKHSAWWVVDQYERQFLPPEGRCFYDACNWGHDMRSEEGVDRCPGHCIHGKYAFILNLIPLGVTSYPDGVIPLWVAIDEVLPIVDSFLLTSDRCLEIVHGAVGLKGQVWQEIAPGNWKFDSQEFTLPKAAEPGMWAVRLEVE